MRSFALQFAAMSAVMLVGACSAAEAMRGDPLNVRQVASGSAIYDRNCASCHGGNLEGQPAWRSRLPNGRLPAPPHDDSGHTWHHADDVLFGLTAGRRGYAKPRSECKESGEGETGSESPYPSAEGGRPQP